MEKIINDAWDERFNINVINMINYIYVIDVIFINNFIKKFINLFFIF